jgi:hypothetical protein
MSMKKFKEYVSEGAETGTLFVTVKNGQAQLRSTTSSGAYHTFGKDVAMAVLTGDTAVVTLKNGVTQLYKVNLQARTVSGPISSY